jgi:hypothetical protein
MCGRVWRVLFLIALLFQISGCGSFVGLRMPESYKDKKLTEDPPTYEAKDKSILDNQK